jgi:biopolymer transport protein ExbD
LATVDANVNSPDPHGPIDRPPPPEPLTVRIEATGYTVSTAVGDRTHIPVLAPGRYDVLALHTHLAAQRNLAPREHAAALAADDGVHYSEVVETMDVLAGSGFSNVTVTGTL